LESIIELIKKIDKFFSSYYRSFKKYRKEKRHPFYMKDNKKYKKISIGEYTYGNPNIFALPNQVSIGKFVSIASGVSIYGGSEHHHNWGTTYPFDAKFNTKDCTHSKGDVKIGNDVWIADGALILSGVTIGDGAVIGARAVVTKDVKPYEIVGGNPSKHIKFRFSQEQIEQLLIIKWWNWDIERIKENFDLLLNENIDEFIKQNTK